MQFEPLNLSHQEMLESKFHQMNLLLSEYSFANLYLFRQTHQYQVIKDHEEVFIKGLTREGTSFIMFTAPPNNLTLSTLQHLSSFADLFFPIPDTWLFPLEQLGMQTSFNEADSDYLFAVSKFAYFPGRNLSKKRNLVKQLLSMHDVKAYPIDHQMTKDALQVLNDWQGERLDASLPTDYLSCQEALQHLEKLHLHGRIIYVDQKPAGFTIGEWISQDCYAVHFCKASRSIKGLYQYLYQNLAQAIEGSCTWINIEQDLGLAAIRDAKRSYLPDRLLHKWRLKL